MSMAELSKECSFSQNFINESKLMVSNLRPVTQGAKNRRYIYKDLYFPDGPCYPSILSPVNEEEKLPYFDQHPSSMVNMKF